MSDTPTQSSAPAGHAAPPKDYPGPLVVLVRLRTRPDQVDAAQQALEKITEPTRANPDCLEFRVLHDRDDPRSFTLLEHWVSLEANTAHGKRDYMAEYTATKNDIFEDISGDFVHELHPPTPAA